MHSTIRAASTFTHQATVSAADMSALEAQIDRLKSRLRLAVIFGGNKAAPDSVLYRSHNTRSWKSYEVVAQDIADSLRRQGFRHVDLMPDDIRLGDRLRRQGTHMAWLNTGGMQGYNPTAHAPSMLEMMGVPYIGHDPLAVSMLDNKHAFKRAAECAGILTPAFTTWHGERGPFRPQINSRFKRAFGSYPGPFVVKPVSGRASLNVHVVPDVASLADVIDEVYRVSENAVLIEQFVPGREVCIAVAGPIIAPGGRLYHSASPFSFAAIERVLSADEQIFTSMDTRAITEQRLKAVDPDRDPKLLQDMRRLAHETYLEFNLSSIIRLDLRADHDGNLYVLEANPKPDLKKPASGVTSLICAGLPEVGMEYDDLILSLFADRLHFLTTHRRGVVQHLFELMEQPSLFDFMDNHRAASHKLAAGHMSAASGTAPSVADICDRTADLNVEALNGALAAAKLHEKPSDPSATAEANTSSGVCAA